MRIQIIPSKDQPTLQKFYGCKVGNIYPVIKVVPRKTNSTAKIQKVWNDYYIEVRTLYPYGNDFKKPTKILLKDTECKVLEDEE